MTATRLRIDLALLPNPYLSDPGALLEAWGEIRITVSDRTQRINLLAWQWDLAIYVEWFVDHYDQLRHDEMCIVGEMPNADESLAYAYDRLSARDFDDDEAEFRWFNELGDYRESHNLRLGLEGTPIPPIFIGINHGKGEVSLSASHDAWPHIADWLLPNVNFGPWAYQFDMDVFCVESKEKINELLKQWYAEATELDTKVRAVSLLRKLGQLP